MPEVLLGWANQILGPCRIVRDCSWQHRMSWVLRLRDRRGAEWILKRHLHRGRYEAEVAAYRRWVPVMGDRAPPLRSCDDGLQAIIVSPVPGGPPPPPAPPPARPGSPPRAGALRR